MRRIHLFEFTDMPWYPQAFRRIQTDYLQFVAARGTGYTNLVPLFEKAMRHAGAWEIVDLCSGGTGPWVRLQEQFRQAGLSVTVKLTDKYPDPESVVRWADASREGLEYLSEPVDAMNVPSHLKGMRTLFEGFHHFRPAQARSILEDAVENRAAIGVFEASLNPRHRWLLLPVMPLMTLASYLLVTPLIRPRSLARLFWTYLIPIVPLATCWDGVISLLRVYSISELQKLTRSLQTEDYVWETGHASMGTPLFQYTYLVGYPAEGPGHLGGRPARWHSGVASAGTGTASVGGR